MQKVEAASNDGDSIEFIRHHLRGAVLLIRIVRVVDERLPLHIGPHCCSLDESSFPVFFRARTITLSIWPSCSIDLFARVRYSKALWRENSRGEMK